jgi:hypothetical protein
VPRDAIQIVEVLVELFFDTKTTRLSPECEELRVRRASSVKSPETDDGHS